MLSGLVVCEETFDGRIGLGSGPVLEGRTDIHDVRPEEARRED